MIWTLIHQIIDQMSRNSENQRIQRFRRAHAFLDRSVDLSSVWLVHNAVFAYGDNQRVLNMQQESLDFSAGDAGGLRNYM